MNQQLIPRRPLLYPRYRQFAGMAAMFGQALQIAMHRYQAPPVPPLFLNMQEAAAYTGLSQKFLRGLIARKVLNVVHDGAGKLRRAELDRLVARAGSLLETTAALKAAARKRRAASA